MDSGIAILEPLVKENPGNLKARNLLGIALTAKKEFPAADRQFKSVLALDPSFSPALKNLATSEMAQHNFAAAERHFRQALALSPNDALAHTGLARLALDRKDYRSAVAHFEEIPPSNRNPEINAELTGAYLSLGRTKEATKLLPSVEVDKLNKRTLFTLGVGLAQSGLYQEAIPYVRALAASYPDSYDTAFNLALCYLYTKQFSLAISTLEQLVTRGHKSAELNNLLAEAYEGNNETQKAIDALREATQLDPKNEDNYVDLVTLCTDKEAYGLAREIIEVGLHYHPKSDRLIFQRGVVEAMTGHFDSADLDFELAGKLAPQKDLSDVASGISYMQRGNTREAINKLRLRIKQKPEDPILLYLLADALIRSGARPGQREFTEAKTALEESVKIDAKFVPSQIDLGKAYLQENRLDDAVKHLEQARAFDPKEKAAYSQLAIAYRKKGEPTLSAQMLQMLSQINDDEMRNFHRERLHVIQAKPPNETAESVR